MVVALDRSRTAADRLQVLVERQRTPRVGLEAAPAEVKGVELDRAAGIAPGGGDLRQRALRHRPFDRDGKVEIGDRRAERLDGDRQLYPMKIDRE